MMKRLLLVSALMLTAVSPAPAFAELPPPTSAPERADRMWRQGDAALKAGDLVAAEKFFNAALAEYPYYAAFNGLGMVALGRKDFVAAEGWYLKATEANPTSKWGWFGLASTRHTLGKNAEALAAVKRATQIDPDYKEAFELQRSIEARLAKTDAKR